MTLTTHALVGAATASFFPTHPYAAFAAGFASHFVIDALPHWDYALEPEFKTGVFSTRDFASILGDALLGFVLTFAAAWFLQIPLWLALIGAGAGIYPDVLSFGYILAKRYAPRLAWAYEPVMQFHKYIQWWEWKGDGSKLGIALQALLVLIVLHIAKFI